MWVKILLQSAEFTGWLAFKILESGYRLVFPAPDTPETNELKQLRRDIEDWRRISEANAEFTDVIIRPCYDESRVWIIDDRPNNPKSETETLTNYTYVPRYQSNHQKKIIYV